MRIISVGKLGEIPKNLPLYHLGPGVPLGMSLYKAQDPGFVALLLANIRMLTFSDN